MNIKKKTITATIGMVLFSAGVMAQNAAIPNTFTAGSEAIADDVNANFKELESAVNSKLDDNVAENRFSSIETDVKQMQIDLKTTVNSKLDNNIAEDRFSSIETDIDELQIDIGKKSGFVASMGYQKTPTVRGVTISNVSLNGGSIIAPVAPGSKVEVSLDYHIIDTGCPGCIDEIQIGFSQLTPAGCVYTGIPGTRGVSGSGKITLTAPAEPGLYYIGVDRAQDFSCPSHWWNGAPKTFNRYIAVITVQ